MYQYSLLILVAFLGTENRVRSEDTAKNDLKQFQGSRQAVAMHSDGQASSKEEVQATRLVVEGNKFTLTGKDFAVTGTFFIESTKTPKTIDVVLASKNNRKSKTTLLGIYKIKGDKRKSCFAFPEKKRPTQFSAAKGYVGFEWKRN
jgi:uncharacterized protein (TIGR03067 family)